MAATRRFVWDAGMSVSVPAPRGGTIGWRWSPGWEAKKANLRVLSTSSTQSLGHEHRDGQIGAGRHGAVGQAEREATLHNVCGTIAMSVPLYLDAIGLCAARRPVAGPSLAWWLRSSPLPAWSAN